MKEKIKDNELLEKKAKAMKKTMDFVSKISNEDIEKTLKKLNQK